MTRVARATSMRGLLLAPARCSHAPHLTPFPLAMPSARSHWNACRLPRSTRAPRRPVSHSHHTHHGMIGACRATSAARTPHARMHPANATYWAVSCGRPSQRSIIAVWQSSPLGTLVTRSSLWWLRVVSCAAHLPGAPWPPRACARCAAVVAAAATAAAAAAAASLACPHRLLPVQTARSRYLPASRHAFRASWGHQLTACDMDPSSAVIWLSVRQPRAYALGTAAHTLHLPHRATRGHARDLPLLTRRSASVCPSPASRSQARPTCNLQRTPGGRRRHTPSRSLRAPRPGLHRASRRIGPAPRAIVLSPPW